MRLRLRFDASLIFLFLIIGIVLVAGASIYLQVRTDALTVDLGRGEPISFLFVVTDNNIPLFTQVFLYHPVTNRSAFLDIPGNLGTIIESRMRVDRIDAVFRPHDAAEYRAVVGGMTGVPISYDFVISLDGVEELVDLVGGVELFITGGGSAVDKPGGLPSGNVVLDGAKVRLLLTQVDAEESDVERIARNQRFLQGLLKRIGTEAAFISRGEVFPYAKRVVRTNFDARSLRAWFAELAKLDTDRITFQRVLGSVRTVDNQDLVFPHFEGQLLRQTAAQLLTAIGSPESPGPGQAVVTMEILNATQVQGLARRTRDIYRSFGFDVVSIRNTEGPNEERTLVIDRRGNIEAARRVAEVIRCTRIITELSGETSAGSADVTLILGKDFDGRYCKE